MAPMVVLLERASARAELDGALDALRHGQGWVVLLHGEAGIGKSSLVRDFLDDQPASMRVLTGRCDDLLVPRPARRGHRDRP